MAPHMPFLSPTSFDHHLVVVLELFTANGAFSTRVFPGFALVMYGLQDKAESKNSKTLSKSSAEGDERARVVSEGKTGPSTLPLSAETAVA